MANQEACELYIEQQIEEGLEEGQTPYYIGKHLSGWIEKLFETKINPKTIEKKAQRQQIKTNVLKESKTPDNQESTKEPPPEKFDSGRGGQREGAGRKISQKEAWKRGVERLKTAIEYIQTNCEVPANTRDEIKSDFRSCVSLLNTFVELM